MYHKTDRKVKPTIVKDYCTLSVSITELQVRYKRMKTRTQVQKNTLSHYGEVYQDVNESFCIIRSISFDVYIHSLLTKMACWCSPMSSYRLQIRLELIYLDFIFMLHYEQRITQVRFNSISMDSDYHNVVFMQCLCYRQRISLTFCCAFLLIFVAYLITFYSVVEAPTLPQVVFNSLRLCNYLSILYVLSGKFQLKFQIWIFKRIT